MNPKTLFRQEDKMKRPHSTTPLAALGFSLLLLACNPPKNEPAVTPTASQHASPQLASMSAEDKALWEQAKGLFKALPKQPASPASNPTTPEKVALGKMLYHDPRLSKSGAFSCNSCHNLASYGVDNRPNSIGHGFKTGERNSPTVLNADLQLAQFWDGRAADLEAQAEGPILNPVEMAMSDESSVLKRLQSIPEYVEKFKAAFPAETPALTYKNTARAIAAFERTLLTPAPFDRYLAGDAAALTADQKAGLRQFVAQGCTACHNGQNIGGALYQKFGAVSPYPHQKDTGRFQVTQQEKDKFVFKVPSLRNVAKTYPYFHDGQIWDLTEAVRTMGKTQLGKELKAQEAAEIVAFLESLTGEIPAEALTLPVLPASGKDTPKPEI